MPLNNLITFRKGTDQEWSTANPILENGEPGWDVTNNIFKIGDGIHPWDQLDSLNTKTIRGSFLLNQPSGSFIIDEGYTVGSLDIFLNGVKLSAFGDYTANDGTSFTLSENAPSGSIVEYLALAPAVSNVGSINFISSGTAPSNPSLGDMWFNTNTGNLFVYIDDGNSTNWIEPFGPPGPSGSPGPSMEGSFSISNSGLNRVLVSDGSTSGIVGQANLAFNGSLLNVTGSGLFVNNVFASGFVRSGGTSSQFLKADGGVDSNSYYLDSNPSGYTSNTGTVTSVSALTIASTGTDVSSSVINNNTTPVITLSIPTASGTARGLLSSDDWTIFNNKQPSGNYSVEGHTHIISEVTGLQTALDGKQPSGVYASGVHSHVVSDITDFDSAVSGLLPVKDIVAGSNISVDADNSVITINSSVSYGRGWFLS